MGNLSVNYVGLELKNPIIVSSCGLTNSIENIKKIEQLGAGAVVLKSIFEEQILFEAKNKASEMGLDNFYDAKNDMVQFFKENSLNKYTQFIKNVKSEVKIPIISSIHCHTNTNTWITYAKEIENAGANALELNITIVPTDKSKSSEFYENIYYEIVDNVKKVVKIPVIIKIGPHFSNLFSFAQKMFFKHKVNGMVLFNRFYQPDIDLKNKNIISGNVFSQQHELSLPLRWIGLLNSEFSHFDIAASTGVYSGEDVAKLIYAGAKVVHICSVLYKQGLDYIKVIVTDFDKWMDENNLTDVAQFRGKLSYGKHEEAVNYERTQFMTYYSSQGIN
jgi:dihydroorotate dehydrogenase (fumarate)